MNQHSSRSDFIGIRAPLAMSAGCETLAGAKVTQEVDRAIASGRAVDAEIPAIHQRLLADPTAASFVNDSHLHYSGFFHFHDLAAKIYHERTRKMLARRSDAPPPARCCGDLYRYRLEETT